MRENYPDEVFYLTRVGRRVAFVRDHTNRARRCSYVISKSQLPNPKHYAVTFLSSQTLRKFDQNASQSACRTSNSAIFSSTGSLASSESSLDSTASNLLSTASKHVNEFLYASGLPYLSVNRELYRSSFATSLSIFCIR